MDNPPLSLGSGGIVSDYTDKNPTVDRPTLSWNARDPENFQIIAGALLRLPYLREPFLG